LVRSAASLRFANKEKEVVPWGDMVSLMVPQGMFTRTKGLLGLNGVNGISWGFVGFHAI
jgi:hypothetical protein